jgi:hypothetical protein
VRTKQRTYIPPERRAPFLKSSGFKNGVLNAGETIFEGEPTLLFVEDVVAVGVEHVSLDIDLRVCV